LVIILKARGFRGTGVRRAGDGRGCAATTIADCGLSTAAAGDLRWFDDLLHLPQAVWQRPPVIAQPVLERHAV